MKWFIFDKRIMLFPVFGGKSFDSLEQAIEYIKSLNLELNNYTFGN